MRIGVICEGPTDYPALEHFLSDRLSSRGSEPVFVPILPPSDNTKDSGGWPNVLLWINNNQPIYRVQRYFGGGLFGGNLSSEALDAILIHIDTDVIEHESFLSFVRSTYDYQVVTSADPIERAEEMRRVLRAAARVDDLTEIDKRRHVFAVAVEATEAWCIAAFYPVAEEWEALRGGQLLQRFMEVLERSEGRVPSENYANCDKSAHRRDRYCAVHATNADRIERSCPSFRDTLAQLSAVPYNP